MPCPKAPVFKVNDKVVCNFDWYSETSKNQHTFGIVDKVHPDGLIDLTFYDKNSKETIKYNKQCGCQYKLAPVQAPNIIAPEDIRVGMTISILSRKPHEGMREDKSFYGEHYEVKDVQLPFVYVPSKFSKTMPPMIFDTRELTLIKIQDGPDLQKEIDNLKETIRTMNFQNIALRRNVNKLNEKISQIRSIAG